MKQRVLGLAALVLAAFLLYLALHGTDWHRVGHLLAGARRADLALAIAMGAGCFALRAARWRLLLAAERPVRFSNAFRATAAGYLGNNFLPARAGELMRSLMIGRDTGLSKSFVLTTALSERAADAIVLVLIGSAALTTVKTGPGWLPVALRTCAGAGILAGLATALAPVFESVLEAAVRSLPLPLRLRETAARVLANVLAALRIYRNPRRVLAFAAISAVVWTCDAIGATIVAKALGLTLPLNGAFLLLAGLGLGSALPSAPGYAGIYQFVAVTILGPFGFSRADAIAYVLLIQIVSWIVILSCGCSLISLPLRFARAQDLPPAMTID